VEGGTYDRTYDLSDAGLPVVPLDGGPTNEADPATVSGFRLDRYLVTVGRFRQFVRAWTAASSVDGGVASMLPAGSGKHTHLNGGRGLAVAPSTDAGQTYEPGWDPSDDGNVAPTTANLACDLAYATWTPSPGNREGLPINCVNWYESYAFCIWDGGFLPSEAEWEYAAAGGSEQRVYPWGTTPPGTDSDYAIYGCDYPLGPGHCESSVADIAPVGTAADGAGRWGQLDLAGELFEWNLDGYSTPYDDPCTDCAFLTSTSTRVIRGGYFLDTSTVLIVSARAGDRPSIRSEGFGFRCARAP
jgi:formylglycine-generating enzyme required for sulfatase activity